MNKVHAAQCSAAVHIRLQDERLKAAFESGAGYALKLVAHVHNGAYKHLEESYEYFSSNNGSPISEEDQHAAVTRALHLMHRQADKCFVDGYHGHAGIKIELISGAVKVTPVGNSRTHSRK